MMLLALVYLWPALVEGRVLSPNSVLFGFWPWHVAAPSDYMRSWNPLLTDVPTAYYPWNVFARQMIHSGVFPAWNPYAYSGTPFYANAQTGLLSPFNVPLWVLPLNYGIALSAWLKLSFGGFGAYLLARELRLGFWPGMLAGVSFLLCAFNVVWLTAETVPAVAATFPWALWLSERLARRRRTADAIGLALVSALAIVAGQPEIAVQVLGGALLYLAIRVATLSGVTRAERFRGLGLGVAGLAVGTLMAAVILLPVLRAGLGTPGAAARHGGDFTLPWSAAKATLFPDWWSRLQQPAPGPEDYLERTPYVGCAALLLALTALVSRGRWRAKLPLTVMASLGIAIPFGVPVVRSVATHLPALGETQVGRLLLWFELAVPVLAAFGLRSLIDAPRRQRAAWTAVALAALAALVAVVTVDPSLHELRTTLNHFRTGRDYPDSKIISLTSIGWWLLFAALLGAVLVLMRRVRYVRLAAGAVVLVAALDLLRFADGFQPMLSRADAIPPSTPAVAYLQRHVGEGRVVGDGFTLDNDYDMVYGLRDVRGYDPPQPSYRYFRLWRLAHPSQDPEKPYEIFGLSPTGRRVMSLLGARYVVEEPRKPAPSGLERSVAYAGPDGTIYENASAAPRALVARRVLVVSSERAGLATIASGRFDPRADVLIERGQPGLRRLPASGSGGEVSVIADENSRVALRAHLRQPGVVVLSDALADGWTVSVDGKARPALRVNDVMRGVIAPAGSHVITWRYRVPGLRLGLLISALAGLLLAGAALALRRSSRACS